MNAQRVGAIVAAMALASDEQGVGIAQALVQIGGVVR